MSAVPAPRGYDVRRPRPAARHEAPTVKRRVVRKAVVKKEFDTASLLICTAVFFGVFIPMYGLSCLFGRTFVERSEAEYGRLEVQAAEIEKSISDLRRTSAGIVGMNAAQDAASKLYMKRDGAIVAEVSNGAASH